MRRHPISEYFLQSNRSVTDPPGQQIVESQKLEGEVPANCQTPLCQGDGERQHVASHA